MKVHIISFRSFVRSEAKRQRREKERRSGRREVRGNIGDGFLVLRVKDSCICPYPYGLVACTIGAW